MQSMVEMDFQEAAQDLRGRPFNDTPLSVPYHEISTENPFHHEAHLRLRSRAGCHPCATRAESSTPAELSVRERGPYERRLTFPNELANRVG